jgi:hypothetical protein
MRAWPCSTERATRRPHQLLWIRSGFGRVERGCGIGVWGLSGAGNRQRTCQDRGGLQQVGEGRNRQWCWSAECGYRATLRRGRDGFSIMLQGNGPVLRHFAMRLSWPLNQAQTRRSPQHGLELEKQQDSGKYGPHSYERYSRCAAETRKRTAESGSKIRTLRATLRHSRRGPASLRPQGRRPDEGSWAILNGRDPAKGNRWATSSVPMVACSLTRSQHEVALSFDFRYPNA